MAEVLAGPRLTMGTAWLCCQLPVLQCLGQLQQCWELLYGVIWSEYGLIPNESEEEPVCEELGAFLVSLPLTSTLMIPAREHRACLLAVRALVGSSSFI